MNRYQKLLNTTHSIHSGYLFPYLRPLVVAWIVLLGSITLAWTQDKDPPYSGTIFPFPDIIQESDPSTFTELKAKRKDTRSMFDRRTGKQGDYEAFIFEAKYSDGEEVEINVNVEFETEEAALAEAEFYATAFGRLPNFLRENIGALWIHQGKELFGGGPNLTIHTGQSADYIRDGILEETLAHEAAHALDSEHSRAKKWIDAQAEDGAFISTYAKANLFREDVAESFVPYLAVRYRADRISRKHLQTITETIPHRIAYFDSLNPDMTPISGGEGSADSKPAAPGNKLPTGLRDWKDADDRPLRADLLRFTNRAQTKAEFRLEDGRKFTIGIDVFSAKDQDFIRSMQSEENQN